MASETAQAIVAGRKAMGIRDIGMGGAMIEYRPDDGQPLITEEIDIVATGEAPVYLRTMRCETVYDILTLAEDQAFSGTTLRLRGLKFMDMTERQKRELGALISHCRQDASFDNGRVP